MLAPPVLVKLGAWKDTATSLVTVPEAVVSFSVEAALLKVGLVVPQLAVEVFVPGVNETGPDKTTELADAPFCPRVTVPVEVPVLMFVAKLLLALMLVVAPLTVAPREAVRSAEAPNVVKLPAAAAVPPMAGGEAK